jgi:hypothetical protein
MTLPSLRTKSWCIGETVLAGIILVGIFYAVGHILLFGFLPPPFFYLPADTFADWFNVAYWSRHPGTHDSWRSIYPPLSFSFIGRLGFDYCYPTNALLSDMRSCDWPGLMFLGSIFIVNVLLTWKVFARIDRKTAPMRTICLALGMPMLTALERGNLILVAYTCVILGFAPLLASSRLRWFFVGLAVNLKVYLVGLIFALLLKRRWVWVEGALICVTLIYVVTLADFGSGTPGEVFGNIVGFSDNKASRILDVRNSLNYDPLYEVLESGSFPLRFLAGTYWSDILVTLLPLLKIATQLLILAAAFAIFLNPTLYSPSRALALGIMMVLQTIGGPFYIMMFVFLFVLMERWRGFGRIWAITACYLLAFPFDYAISYLPPATRALYFVETSAEISTPITIGPFIRPFLVMTMMWAISLTTVQQYRKAKKLDEC